MTTPRIICIDPGKKIAIGYKDDLGEWRSSFLPGKKLFKGITDEQELWQVVIPRWAERVIEPLLGKCVVGVEDFLFQGGARTSFSFMNRLIGSLVIAVGRLSNVEKVVLIPNRKWEVAFFGGNKKMNPKQRKLIQCAKLDVALGLFNEHELDALCMAQWLEKEIKFGSIR